MTAAPTGKRRRRWWLRAAVLLILLALALVRPYRVTGPSMGPSLTDGSWVLTLPYLGDPQPGDVVVFQAPDGSGWSIKRVVGTPGDRPNREWLSWQPADGRPTIETSRLRWGSDPGPQPPLAENRYFLLGDDPSQSVDSRDYGPVGRSAVRRYVFASW